MRIEIREASPRREKKIFTVLLVRVIAWPLCSQTPSQFNASRYFQPFNPQSFHFFILKDKKMEPPCLILASAELKPQAYLACAGERQRNRTEGLFLEGERELQSALLSSALCILIDTSIASR